MELKKVVPVPKAEKKVEVKVEKGEIDPRVIRHDELSRKSPLTPPEWIEFNNLDTDLKTEGKI